ncbi:MAG: hypothetical protein RBT59_07075, partial [Arcobacteraceae bacterium]|nr:hypothetical protein [Arcobacteraceae bacterium]
ANFDKVGTPSELRQNITKEVQNKINEFRVTNNLNDNIDFFQYKEQLNFQKEQSREIGGIVKSIKSNTPLEQTVVEKYDLSGDRGSDLEKLAQAKSEFTLDTQQKELNSLNGLLEKNEKLQPLFNSDLKKIDAGGINFKDETLVNIKVDVISNTSENNKLLNNSFNQMIGNAQNELKSFEINTQDKEALTKIFEESKKNSVFKDDAKEYLKNAVDITQSKTFIGLLAETKTLQSMQYLLNAEEKGIDNVPKAFLEARNIDTSIFTIEKIDKHVPAIQMGSEDNLKAFQEFKEESFSKTNEEVKVSLSDISAAICRSFTKSEPNNNKEERLEDWAILKSAPKEAINILKSFSKQAQEEEKDANWNEARSINKDIEGYKATIESLEKIKETAKTVQKETLNKVDEVQKPIEEKTSQTSPKFETNKISQQELNELKTMTKEHLLYADPANVLNALGIDYKVEQGGSRYSFSIRAEDKTKSAFMYIGKSGAWQFKDFGSNQSGTIENVVMLATGMNYKDALNYCLDANGLKNLVSEAIDINKSQHQIQLTQEHRDKLEALKNANLEKHSKSDVHSRVVSYREITQKDTTVLNFLEARGIDGIPKDMFIIEGEASGVGKDGNAYTYKNIGVGVLTGDMSKPIDLEKVGADIHFLNPKTKADGSIMKTQSFGVKDITIIPGENADGKNISVFESKMDYAAAAVKLDLSETTSVIANGVGNASKISEFIKETNLDNVTFFNQNDKAGEKFVENVVEKANIDKFDFIKYEEGELKLDINDLVKNNVQLEDRLITNGNIEVFLEMSTLKSVEQLEVEAMISKGDFKGAEQLLQDATLDKNIVENLTQRIDVLKTLEQVNNTDTTYEVEINANKTDEQEAKERLAVQEKLMEDEIVKNETEDLENQQHQKQEEKAIEKSIEMGM